jgi:hypothetical protein
MDTFARDPVRFFGHSQLDRPGSSEMTPKIPDVLAVLKSCSVFATLGETQLRELAGKARIQRYSERTLLTLRGEMPEYIRYIAHGSADLVLSTADGGYSSLPMFEGRWATCSAVSAPNRWCMTCGAPVQRLMSHFPAATCRRRSPTIPKPCAR